MLTDASVFRSRGLQTEPCLGVPWSLWVLHRSRSGQGSLIPTAGSSVEHMLGSPVPKRPSGDAGITNFFNPPCADSEAKPQCHDERVAKAPRRASSFRLGFRTRDSPIPSIIASFARLLATFVHLASSESRATAAAGPAEAPVFLCTTAAARDTANAESGALRR
jgi:hypothetical protein